MEGTANRKLNLVYRCSIQLVLPFRLVFVEESSEVFY